MPWRWMRAHIIHVLGGNGRWPKRTTLIKLSLGSGFALAIAVILNGTVKPFRLPPNIPLLWQWSVCGVLFQGISFIGLFLARTAGFDDGTFTRLIGVLPLTRQKREIIRLTPLVIIMILLTIILLPPIWQIAVQSGLPTSLVLIAASIGCISGLGLVARRQANLVGLFLTGLIIIGMSANLLAQMTDVTSLQTNPEVYSAAIIFLLLAPCLWLRPTTAQTRPLSSPIIRIQLPTSVAARYWFGLKLLRHPGPRKAILLTSCVGLGLLAWMFANPQAVIAAGVGPWVSILGLSAGVMAIDFRTSVKPITPVEIINLRGSVWFWLRYISTTFVAVAVVLSPLLLVVIALTVTSLVVCLQLIAGIIFAISLSVLVSNAVSLESGDVASQFMATALVIGGFLAAGSGLDRMHWNSSQMVAVYILLGGAALSLGLVLECYRNRYFWHILHKEKLYAYFK